MKKRFIILLCSVLLFACSHSASPNPFFKAWQKLFEEPYIAIDGNLQWGQIELSLKGTLENDPLGAALVLREDPPLEFYLKDGKTYLNDDGTKTSSLAENIGLGVKSLSMLNPFLNLSPSERKVLFDSVELSGDTYSMKFSPAELAKALDNYGAISITSADMKATVQEDIVTWFSVNIEGTFNFDTDNPSPFMIKAEFSCSKVDGIDYPNDLSSYQSSS